MKLVPSHKVVDGLHTRMLVDLANANDQAMDGTITMVTDIINSADIVFAVWQDVREPEGVGKIMIKGEARARDIVAAGAADRCLVQAIACICAEQAYALQDLFGERQRLN